MLDHTDTIVAPASSAGGWRSIVRLSGPAALDVVERCVVLDESDWRLASRSRRWTGALRLAAPLGETPAAVFVWPGVRSYTRQPSAEWHLPGGAAVQNAAVRLACQHGARLAAPGEFTLRAFLAGRIDLTQCEAVLAVVDADDERQLQAALEQLAGGLARPVAALRERLLTTLAHLEAGLDFVEDDIEFINSSELAGDIETAILEARRLLAQIGDRVDATEAPEVVLYGRPNTGKSTLFNALAGRDAAIVSPRRGTTRDFVTARIRLADREVELVDTAGFDPAAPAGADRAAQQSAEERVRLAQLRVLCLDAASEPDSWERQELAAADRARLVVWTKCDLQPPPPEAVHATAQGRQGVAALRSALSDCLASQTPAVAATSVRCADALRLAVARLQSAAELNALAAGEELIAAELRAALDDIGQVAGTTDHEDVLDQIFSRFCIGK